MECNIFVIIRRDDFTFRFDRSSQHADYSGFKMSPPASAIDSFQVSLSDIKPHLCQESITVLYGYLQTGA
jgi:hypothetical protein